MNYLAPQRRRPVDDPDLIRLCDLPSRRHDTTGRRTAPRIDPFYDPTFRSGAITESRDIDSLRRSEPRLPAPLRVSPAAAITQLRSARQWTDTILLLGAIHGWRGLMPQQAAALLDRPGLVSHRRPVFTAALAAELITYGVPPGGPMKLDPLSDAVVWRAGSRDAFKSDLSPILTGIERAAILGGQSWDPVPRYDRHLVLSAELGLRAAEHLPWVGTVVGEQFSGLTTMGLQRPAALTIGRFATKATDLTIVRHDGLRIAVEITATERGLRDKVEAWAEVLLANPLHTSGVVVLFVDAARDDRNMRTQLEGAFRRVGRKFPGADAPRLWNRLLLASWSDWFPTAGVATRAFTRLTARAMTGPGASTWKHLALDDYPFDPHDGWNPTAVIDNAAVLAQTPAWLRHAATPPDPTGLLLRRAGLTGKAMALEAATWTPPKRLAWPGLKARPPVDPFAA